MKEDVEEKQTAVGIDALISSDIKNIEEYEKAIIDLKLQIMSSKKTEELDFIEEKFKNLKEKIKTLINKYKMPSDEFDKIAKVIDYKEEKEIQYLIACITHQAYNIPIILEKIIVLEDQLESMDAFLFEHKYIKNYPSKRWEMFEHKKFNVKQECLKFNETLEKQIKYINAVKQKFDGNKFSESVKEHIYALNNLSKKINNIAKSYKEGQVIQKNLLSLMITLANADNMLRAFKEILYLDNNPNYINHITFEEELKKHLDDFRLLRALNVDLINLSKTHIIEFKRAFKFIENDNPFFDDTVENLSEAFEIFTNKLTELENL